MFKINIFKLDSGNWLAYLSDQPEYWEQGKTRPEAIGKLLELMIENTVTDYFEITEIDKNDKYPDIKIMQKLNVGEIL